MTLQRLSLGKEGERFAVKHLKKMGYRIKECNYVAPVGEIDIIATDQSTLVFVEVKTRKSASFGAPFEAINQRKKKQIEKTALYYMNAKKIRSAARVDVVSIVISGGKMNAEVIKDAFDFSPT